MSEEVQPPELARVLDVAERPRADDWTLRSGLTRYAQPQPQRASDITHVVRRVEAALKARLAAFRRNGPGLWAAVGAVDGDGDLDEAERPIVELLRIAVELDRLGDVLAEWAVAGGPQRPDDEVEKVTASLAQRLDGLGVPREEGPPRPGPGGRPRRGA